MRKELLRAEPFNKYLCIDLPKNTPNTGNDPFELLLDFIGKHYSYKDRLHVGSAYMVIRIKTNELLGVSMRNRIRRTSKREISSIRYFYKNRIINNKNALHIKIPYKISFILRAIIFLIEGIHERGIAIPQELQGAVNQTYKMAFYKPHSIAYDSIKANILKTGTEIQRALHDDFFDQGSSLNAIFK